MRRARRNAAPGRAPTSAAGERRRLGARARGIRFFQHNHSGEFALENGTRLYDVILEETDPRLVFFELDIFWAYVGQSRFPGFEPHEYPWLTPERSPLFHVKDGLDFSNADAAVPRPPGPSSFEWFMRAKVTATRRFGRPARCARAGRREAWSSEGDALTWSKPFSSSFERWNVGSPQRGSRRSTTDIVSPAA